jgi:hypothetical protein
MGFDVGEYEELGNLAREGLRAIDCDIYGVFRLLVEW